MKTSFARTSFIGILFFTMLSCSLFGPLRKDKGAKNYEIQKSLTGWRLEKNWEEADYLYIHKKSSAHITVTSLCERYEVASLESLSKSALSSLKRQEVLSSEIKMIDSREALQKNVKGSLDGVPVQSMITVLRKGDCIFDFFLTGFKGIREEEMRAYESLINSFHYKGY